MGRLSGGSEQATVCPACKQPKQLVWHCPRRKDGTTCEWRKCNACKVVINGAGRWVPMR